MANASSMQREELQVTTSRDVIGAKTAAAVDAKSGVVSADTGFVLSVMPSGAQLNGPAAVRFLRSDPSVQDQSLGEIDLGSIPTADYITHTSMKTGSKLVIRIVPMSSSADGGSNVSTVSALTKAENKELYFPQVSLQAVNELTEERFQLFEGFDAHKLLMFGSKPKIWSYQLMVLNGARPDPNLSLTDSEWLAENMDFADELYRRYEKYYRGTKCAETNARCFLTYENRVIEGYLVMLSLPRNATMPQAIPMNLTIVVTNDHFTADGLERSRDRTLSDLLEEERTTAAKASSLSPTELVNARLTEAQRTALYNENQAAASEAQSTTQQIREQATRAQAMQKETASRIADVAALQVGVEQELLLATSDLERATLLESKAFLDQQQVELLSMQQELGQTAALSAGSFSLSGEAQQLSLLEQQTQALNAIEHKQRQMENNLQHAVQGDLTSAIQQDRVYAEVLVTNPDGTRTLTTYDVTSSGGPDETDATVVGEALSIKDVTEDPSYAGIPDSTTQTRSRVFSP